MVASDTAAQGRGPDSKSKRRMENDGFTIDAGVNGGIRVHLEFGRAPGSNVRFASGAPDHGDPQRPLVEPWSGAVTQDGSEPVAVGGI
jgi:hypothetical protein